MNLNMHILQEDLKGYGLEGRITANPLDLTIKYCELCKAWPREPQQGILYVVEARSLPAKPPRMRKLSLICSGEPPTPWQTCAHDVLWTRETGTSGKLINELWRLFYDYAEWESRLMEIVDRELPLDELGKASQPLFGNPLEAHNTSFRTLFETLPSIDESDERFERYERYRENLKKSGPYLNAQDIVSVAASPEFKQLNEALEPTLFDTDDYDYSTLVYGVRIAGELCAYVCIDDVLAPFTLRDKSLLKHLGDILGRMLERNNAYASMRPKEVQDILTGLLEHRKLLPEQDIANLLRYFSWDMHDTYVVMVAALRDTTEQRPTLEAMAIHFARPMGSDCFIVLDEVAVFVFNLTQLKTTLHELADAISPMLKPLWLDASFSTCFDDFKDIYYYYRQTMDAGMIGYGKNPDLNVYLFEEDAADYICQKLVEKTIPSVYYPDELKALVAYDLENETDYVHLLGAFLENERNIARTIRQEYLHRNTFNYRMRRITEILGINLDDPDVRFRLLVAYRIMEHEKQ